jgi:hypothetical protein
MGPFEELELAMSANAKYRRFQMPNGKQWRNAQWQERGGGGTAFCLRWLHQHHALRPGPLRGTTAFEGAAGREGGSPKPPSFFSSRETSLKRNEMILFNHNPNKHHVNHIKLS